MRGRVSWLYGLTLCLELVAVPARLFVSLIPAVFAVSILTVPFLAVGLLVSGDEALAEGWFTSAVALSYGLAGLLALAPLLLSLLTLISPGGFVLTRFRLGAREPSTRERRLLLAALEQLSAGAPAGTLGPSRWLVLDESLPNAFVLGTAIYVTRGLINSPYLLPVLAHELYHLNSGDGRLTLALRRLVLPPFAQLARPLRQAAPRAAFVGAMTRHPAGCLFGGTAGVLMLFLSLAGGGFGLWATRYLWARYWQGREFAADAFAAACGLGLDLAAYLEAHQFFDVPVPYLFSEHPYVEERIDRLVEL